MIYWGYDMNTEKVNCSDCDFYKLDNQYRTIPSFQCQHKECFILENKNNSVLGQQIVKTRIKGYAQLNRNSTCNFYRKKWWKFWIQ